MAKCGAKTRAGTPCQRDPAPGKTRCHYHGGASPGAPRGNTNAVTHGIYAQALLPGEEDIYDKAGPGAGIEQELRLARVRLARINKAERAALEASADDPKTRANGLDLDEVSHEVEKEANTANGKTSPAQKIKTVSRRRDFTLEAVRVTRLIAELEMKHVALCGRGGEPREAAREIQQALQEMEEKTIGMRVTGRGCNPGRRPDDEASDHA